MSTVPIPLTWGELRRFAEQYVIDDDAAILVEADTYGEVFCLPAVAEVKAIIGGPTVVVFSQGV